MNVNANLTNVSTLLELAKFGNQAIDLLTGNSDSALDVDFAGLLNARTGLVNGRNPTLFDPESGYRMMSRINEFEVSFKAQHAELSAMGDSVEHMEDAGRLLAEIDAATGNTDIRTRLQGFVDDYNAWVDRFAPTVAEGGVLDNIQAAEISLYELEQSVTSIFNGAAAGVSGLGELGVAIDRKTAHASLDTAKLDAVLAQNKAGAVSAIDEFSANFAKSADLLNQPDNFIPTQLDNRSRAIDFIASNRVSLQAEFGTGDAAKPGGQVARALSAYERMAALV